MNRQLLLNITQASFRAAGDLAAAALEGDSGAEYIMRDALAEEGISIMFDDVEVGTNVFVETVTKYWYGTVKSQSPSCIVLHPSAWIPDTGRFSEFLKTGSPNEAEPCGDVPTVIPVGVVTAILGPMNHPVPTKVK